MTDDPTPKLGTSAPAQEKSTDSRPQKETTKADTSSPNVSFAQLLDENVRSPLTRELVRHGYLTHQFARYSAKFYDKDVGLDAADYIARYIEPGVPEFDYELDTKAVAQILREQDAQKDSAELFDDPSIDNVDNVAYLLEHRPGAARRVAEHLARWEDLERGFVDVFVARSKHGCSLAGLMAPSWEQALRYVAVDAPVDPKVRLELVDAVLGAVLAGERDDLDGEVAGYLAANYQGLTAIASPADQERAAVAMGVVAASGASLASVVPLTRTAQTAAVRLAVYPVTEGNLTELAPGDSIALDVLRDGRGTRPVYDHAVANLADYLIALEKSGTTTRAVEDPTAFAEILADVAEAHGPELIGRFVDATGPGCQVRDLDDVPDDAWPVLAARGRTEATFANIQRYIEQYGVDEELGSLLAERRKITTAVEVAEPDRLAVAVELLGAREAIADPKVRIALANSLTPGQIPAAKIEPEDSNLISLLLAAKLVADDESAFEQRLMADTGACEAAVAASAGFAGFAEPSILPAARLPGLLRSRRVREETKRPLISRLTELLPGATSPEAEAVAAVLAEQKRTLRYEQLSALRAAGVKDGPFVRLLAGQGADLDYEDLKTLLREMGGDCQKVADGGSGAPKFPVDDEHRAVLSRLTGDTHSGLKDETFRTLGGRRLVARLKRPRA